MGAGPGAGHVRQGAQLRAPGRARVSDVALARVGDAARMAYTHGGWPVAYEVAGRMGHARTGHQASRRPTATDGVGSAAEGSSRSMATVVDDEEAGRGSMLSAASPAPPSSAAGRAARDGENAGRRSLLGGASPVPPSPSVRDGEDAGRRSLLAGAGPLPSSSAAAGEAKDGEDGDLRTEPSAGSPASPSHRARRRMTISWAAVPPTAVGRPTIERHGGGGPALRLVRLPRHPARLFQYGPGAGPAAPRPGGPFPGPAGARRGQEEARTDRRGGAGPAGGPGGRRRAAG